MKTVSSVRVELDERSYDVRIGEGLLVDAPWWAAAIKGTSVALVTNDTVGPLYEAKLTAVLADQGVRVVNVRLPDGEQYKNWEHLNHIYAALLGARCDRSTTVVALGGGVVGDMAGFAAATYQRGIPVIQVPTTLLAQVDSSVGGKTGINHPLGKNMIGAFHQPHAVVIDVGTLKTLPAREVSAGLAEIIKHGAIADLTYLEWLETQIDALRALDSEALSFAIEHSVRIKAGVVRDDERESGARALLNFGHTFGHAIEAGLGYGSWLHGEAVGAGMVQAADLSVRAGTLKAEDAARLRRLIERAGLPVAAPDFGAPRWRELMSIDKKNRDGRTQFITLNGLGHARWGPVDDALVLETLSATAIGPTR